MRITVADAISPSYFVAIAAVQLGFFKEEGVDCTPSPAGGAAPSCAPFRTTPTGSCRSAPI
jgi:hypothetical protein